MFGTLTFGASYMSVYPFFESGYQQGFDAEYDLCPLSHLEEVDIRACEQSALRELTAGRTEASRQSMVAAGVLTALLGLAWAVFSWIINRD